MGAIEPSEAQMKQLLELPDDGPVVMINLLRYREQAAYPAGTDEPPCTGREAYGRYSAGVTPLLGEHGGRPIWIGLARATVIAPDAERWDDAILVEYPSRQAFLDMVSSEPYRAIAHHRTAALDDSRLIATSGTLVPPPPAS